MWFPFGYWGSVFLNLLFGALFVGSLYVWPAWRSSRRDDPRVLLRRMISVSVVCVLCPFLLWCLSSSVHPALLSSADTVHDVIGLLSPSSATTPDVSSIASVPVMVSSSAPLTTHTAALLTHLHSLPATDPIAMHRDTLIASHPGPSLWSYLHVVPSLSSVLAIVLAFWLTALPYAGTLCTMAAQRVLDAATETLRLQHHARARQREACGGRGMGIGGSGREETGGGAAEQRVAMAAPADTVDAPLVCLDRVCALALQHWCGRHTRTRDSLKAEEAVATGAARAAAASVGATAKAGCVTSAVVPAACAGPSPTAVSVRDVLHGNVLSVCVEGVVAVWRHVCVALSHDLHHARDAFRGSFRSRAAADASVACDTGAGVVRGKDVGGVGVGGGSGGSGGSGSGSGVGDGVCRAPASDLTDPHVYVLPSSSLILIRNVLFAPLSEELVFRACGCAALLAAGASLGACVWIGPVCFALAHAHHVFELVRVQGYSLAQSVTAVAIQLGYTSLFGAYAALLHIRLHSLPAAIAAHALCNSIGLPAIGARVEVYSDDAAVGRCAKIVDSSAMVLHVVGCVGFLVGIVALCE